MRIYSLKGAALIAVLGILLYLIVAMSIFRNVVWYVKGLREFTKSGYEAAAKNFNPSDLEVDCSSRSFIITGANSGLGYEAALEIAKRNGTVHLVCRNEEFGKKAKEDLITETKNDKIHLHIVDMSKPKQIAEFTSSFASSTHQLDVLINNAGCLMNERKKTEEELDISFATNTLGYYQMTQGLLDRLSKSEDPRVIMVSSGGMFLQKLDYEDFNFDKMDKYDGIVAYSQNKRQEVVMCEQFAKSHPKVFFASMHPGWADTPGVRTSIADFYTKMKDKFRTASQGADTITWLAVSPTIKSFPSGSFFQDRVPVSTHLPLAWTRSSDEENAEFMKRLTDLSTKLVN